MREIGELSEAVATYASRAGGELRRDGSVAGTLTVFLMTNRFSSSPQYSKSAVLSLTPATDCDSDLIKAAVRGLKQIYRSGYTFHKTGVILTDLTPARELQTDLFACRNYDRCQRLNRAVDRVNVAFGAGTIRYAATGIRKRWKVRSDFRSPCYTTCWDEVPRVLAIRKS